MSNRFIDNYENEMNPLPGMRIPLDVQTARKLFYDGGRVFLNMDGSHYTHPGDFWVGVDTPKKEKKHATN